jgi:hypothetical protein
MTNKWQKDGIHWSGDRWGTGTASKVVYPIAGVSRTELEELASKSWLEVPQNKRKKRAKAIVEIDKRDKLARKRLRMDERRNQ